MASLSRAAFACAGSVDPPALCGLGGRLVPPHPLLPLPALPPLPAAGTHTALLRNGHPLPTAERHRPAGPLQASARTQGQCGGAVCLVPRKPGLDESTETHPRMGMPPCRRHADLLNQVACRLQACCDSLAAVIRNNAPVRPALQALGGLEAAFLELQLAVEDGVPAGPNASSAFERDIGGITCHTGPGSPASSGGASSPCIASVDSDLRAGLPASQPKPPSVAGSAMAAPSACQDSLALHLALSTLFTCCSQVCCTDESYSLWICALWICKLCFAMMC